MKKLLQSFLAFSLFGSSLNAETFVVLTGASIQQQIDAAVDGDIIAVFGGTYSQDVVINKKVRLVELAGQDVHITGNVTFDSVEDCPPFQGFKVGSPSKGIVVTGATTGLVIKDVETPTLSAGITMGGDSEVSIVGGNHEGISQNGGSLVVNSTTITGDFVTGGEVEKTVGFRVTVEGECFWAASGVNAWFGYGTTRRFRCEGSDSNITYLASTSGSSTNPVGDGCLVLDGSGNTYTIINSQFFAVYSSNFNSSIPNGKVGRFGGSGNVGVIRNNYISLRDDYGTNTERFFITDGDNTWHIESNYIKSTRNGSNYSAFVLIDGTFGTNAKRNYIEPYDRVMREGGDLAFGAATSIDNTGGAIGSALIVDGSPYILDASSPLIDEGLIDLRFSDRDGSRNNIGPSGGSWYDPDGWTTENPVVISFDLSPDQAVGGVNNEVEISEVQVISAP